MTDQPAAPQTGRPCPVCGSRAQHLFARERFDASRVDAYTYASRKQPEFMCLRLVRCLNCDLIYAPHPPPQTFLSHAYADAAYDSGPEARAAAATYAAALEGHIGAMPLRGAAVDVGAGSGPLLPWLAEQGFAPVVGIEPSLAAIAAADPEVAPMLRAGVFSPAAIAGLHPALVCSFMTLEHLDDPLAFARGAFDALQPGGMLAIVVHDWRAPLNRMLGLRSPIIDVEHLQLFSQRSVARLLVAAGFERIVVQPLSNNYPLRYWLRLTPLPVRLKRGLGRLIERARLAAMPISLRVGNRLALGYKPLEQRP